MRTFITWITAKLKSLVGEENWNDPVWSKVISNGIIAAISILLCGCTLLLGYFGSLIIKVPFGQILLILQHKTEVSNWVLFAFLVLLVSSVINFIYKKSSKTSINRQSKASIEVGITNKFLIGRWVNQWTNGGTVGTEEVEITNDMKYYKDGTYSFDIVDFEYSKKLNKIFFIKSSIRSMDFGKRFRNNLFVLNTNLISGIEDGYEIKYKRFYIPDKIDFDFIVGHWRNQWTSPMGTDFEICQINADKEYWTRGELFFTIQNFTYDSSTRTFTFFKAPYKKDDPRPKSSITLTIKDNDTLVGREGDSDILFTREF
jgi:hypothetical protein